MLLAYPKESHLVFGIYNEIEVLSLKWLYLMISGKISNPTEGCHTQRSCYLSHSLLIQELPYFQSQKPRLFFF